MKRKVPLVLIAVAVCVAGAAVFTSSSPTAVGQDAATYKGSKACKACHADQHGTWLEMKHSKAFDVLTPEQIASGKDEKGRACVSCHTTGYGKGGFTTADATPNLKEVGCEACHGAGSQHVKLMLGLMMEEKEPTPDMDKHISKSADCTQCHNPHISYKKLYGSK